MPKTRSSKKKAAPAKASARKKTAPKKSRAPVQSTKKENYSEEYTEYLERYALYGEGRPRLSPAEFDRLDDELLDLLAQEMERGLDDEQVIRLKELEFLLLDSEQ